MSTNPPCRANPSLNISLSMYCARIKAWYLFFLCCCAKICYIHISEQIMRDCFCFSGSACSKWAAGEGSDHSQQQGVEPQTGHPSPADRAAGQPRTGGGEESYHPNPQEQTERVWGPSESEAFRFIPWAKSWFYQSGSWHWAAFFSYIFFFK